MGGWRDGWAEMGQFSTSAADKYNNHVTYLGALQPKLEPNFSYQTHVTVIFIGRAHMIYIGFSSLLWCWAENGVFYGISGY